MLGKFSCEALPLPDEATGRCFRARVPDRLLGLSVQEWLLVQRQLLGTKRLPSGKTLLCCRRLVEGDICLHREVAGPHPIGKEWARRSKDMSSSSQPASQPRTHLSGLRWEKMQLREPAPKTKIQSCSQQTFRVDTWKKGHTMPLPACPTPVTSHFTACLRAFCDARTL